MKRCGSCGETKAFSEFYVSSRKKEYTSSARYNPDCKECIKSQRAEYRIKKRAENPNWQKDMDLNHNFGISTKEWNSMFQDQGGCCAICKVHQSELKRNMHVDHCHATGKIRGLLCSSCNVGIGYLKEDIQNFQSAILYIEKFKSTSGEVIPLKKEG